VAGAGTRTADRAQARDPVERSHPALVLSNRVVAVHGPRVQSREWTPRRSRSSKRAEWSSSAACSCRLRRSACVTSCGATSSTPKASFRTTGARGGAGLHGLTLQAAGNPASNAVIVSMGNPATGGRDASEAGRSGWVSGPTRPVADSLLRAPAHLHPRPLTNQLPRHWYDTAPPLRRAPGCVAVATQEVRRHRSVP